MVLVVSVRVDDHIGAQAQAGIQPSHEAGCQSHVPRQAHDVVGPGGLGRLGSPIQAAIVDHQRLDGLDFGELPGQGLQGLGDILGFVVAGDLDD